MLKDTSKMYSFVCDNEKRTNTCLFLSISGPCTLIANKEKSTRGKKASQSDFARADLIFASRLFLREDRAAVKPDKSLVWHVFGACNVNGMIW